MGQVQIGFFKNFKSSDTVLIGGDSEGLRSLADVLRKLATTHSIKVVALHNLPFVEVHNHLQILAYLGGDSGARFQQPVVVAWTLSAEGWADVADKIDVLCEVSSGHQYLDRLSDITVQASTGEYGGAWWQTH